MKGEIDKRLVYGNEEFVSELTTTHKSAVCLDIVWQILYIKDMAIAKTKRTDKLDLRLSKSAKQTLQAAAATVRKSVSEFVLDTALSEAEERLADRRVFTLDAEQWKAFVAALDAPPQYHARLERLFRESSVFDPKF